MKLQELQIRIDVLHHVMNSMSWFVFMTTSAMLLSYYITIRASDGMMDQPL